MARLAIVPQLETELDRLYELPLDEFTPARNELAARLKKAGQGDAAARVKELKKPTVAVWTANQLARREQDEVARLVEAGGRLRAAQEKALRGGDPDAVRAATRDERDALRKLTRLAEAVLEDAGRPASPQTLERVSSTLRAAAVDSDAAQLLTSGRLAEEVEAPGFTALAGIAPAGRARQRARPTSGGAAARREHEQRIRRLRRDADSAEGAAAAAEAEAERAAREAAEARDRAKQARRDARAAAKALETEERR
ncbi:MAG: hypothetical protein ACJ747_03090 [Gaiellaceae bacterium]